VGAQFSAVKTGDNLLSHFWGTT